MSNRVEHMGMELIDQLSDKFTIGDGCWEWTAGRNTNGYGAINIARRQYRAHRVMYEWLVGPIPSGMDLDHLCRNRACVRPDHLEPVSRQTNLLRGKTLTAANAAKTHCDAGHELTIDNVYERPDRPGRMCRQCRREVDRRRYHNNPVRNAYVKNRAWSRR